MAALVASLAALTLAGGNHGGAAQASDDVAGIGAVLVPVAEELAQPVLVTHAGDRSGRLFVPEKGGRIHVVLADGTMQVDPFLDISDRVKSDLFEQGLLGLAFHPDFESNGRFYVDYTRQPDGATVISEFRADGSVADGSSERAVIIVPQPGVAHNAGMLAFDAHGLLLASFGDGSFEVSQRADAQDATVIYGKIVGLDVDLAGRYDIDEEGRAKPGTPTPQVVAKGLRNPWRFSIDRDTGHIYIGDVGLYSWEEIDVVAPGSETVDFGWRRMEGPQCGPDAMCRPDTWTAPVIAYAHAPFGTVIGGYAYRGDAEPLLAGLYVFGDFSLGQIRAAPVKDMWAGAAEATVIHERVPGGVQSFGEDEDGELYVATTNSVFRISAEPVPLVTPRPTQRPRHPIVITRPFDISDVVVQEVDPVPTEAATPDVLRTNDAVLSEGPDGCITVESTGIDPFVEISVPSGKAVHVDPVNEGLLQVFLAFKRDSSADQWLVSEDQSVRIDVAADAYEIVPPPRPAGDPSVLRVDPPQGTSSVCLVSPTG